MFPRFTEEMRYEEQRDNFAAIAMLALLHRADGDVDGDRLANLARASYRMASAMLEAKEYGRIRG